MDRQDVVTWVNGYIKAWYSNVPDDIGRLFARNGRHFTEPFREPWHGREEIIAEWLAHKDEPGTFTFDYQVLGVSDNTGFVRCWTRYLEPPAEYSNLWVIRLNEQGECEEFIEWWMKCD